MPNCLSYRWAGVLCALLALAGAGAAVAQPSPVETAPTSSAPTPPLSDRQQELNARMERLQAQMMKLARLLADKDAAKAERLRAALEQQGELEVNRKLERILELLRSADFSDADAAQAQAVSDLARMLETLNDTGLDLAHKREQRERLAELRRSVQRLMDAQIDTLQKTRAAANRAALAEQLNQQAAELQAIAEEQQKLREESQASPASAPAENATNPAARQQELADRTQKATQALRAAGAEAREQGVSRSVDDAAQAAEAARQAMMQAAQRMGQSGASSPQSPQASTQPTQTPSSEQAQSSSSEAAQQQAEESLKRAIRRLRDEARRLSDRREIREIERQQRRIEQQAGDSEDQMRQSAKDGKPHPGQEQMGRARRKMQDAADRLGERDAKSSQEPQTQSLEELQQTMNQLSDALRQTREEEMEETLVALEARFRAILTRQEQLREGLTPLANQASRSRAEELSLLELAGGQRTLAEEMQAVRQLLVDEGTTLILPQLVANVSRDMSLVAARLDQLDASPATVQLVEDILAALREILAALEQRREEMSEQQGQQPGAGQQGAAALLPSSAELKLVKAAQLRINTETQNAAGTDVRAMERLHDLAQRQRELGVLTIQMHERR